LLGKWANAAVTQLPSSTDLHALSEHDLEIQSMGFIEVIEQMV
jgi:hypothetical protein